MRHSEIANTIKKQLGVMSLLMMGAHTLVSIPPAEDGSHNGGLGFMLGDFTEVGGVKDNIEAIRILLSPLDYYNVEFFKDGPNPYRTADNVFVGDLHSLIERATGLSLRL